MAAATSGLSALETELQDYLAVWTENLSRVLTRVAGAAFGLESAAPPETASPDQDDSQFVVVAAGSLRGEMSLRIPKTSVLAFGQLSLREPRDAAAELKPNHREALQKLLRETANLIATALNHRWGDVQLRVESGPAPTWSPAARGWLGSVSSAPFPVFLEWQVSPALVAALRPVLDRKTPSAETSPGSPSPAAKFELLMDAELDVTLRFGKRSMLLREVMELDAGSVVELDRQVQEPVDLLLAGRLIARGEVVVVNGNYGLRVLEVVPPPPH